MRAFLGALLLAVGLAAIAFGVLFMLQGAGIVHWPRESFMLDERVWIWRGLAVALAGGLAAIAARRI